MISSYEAFLEGIKPSTYVNLDILSRPELIPELQKYPSWNECENFWLFFRSEEKKERFLNEYRNLNESGRHRLLGLELGFPPKAVDFYVKQHDWYQKDQPKADEWFFSNKAGLHYHGIRFASHIDDLHDNVRWLWHTYKIDEPIEISVGSSSGMWIQYRNKSDIHNVSVKAKELLHKESPALT